jgi:hypothetical protein
MPYKLIQRKGPCIAFTAKAGRLSERAVSDIAGKDTGVRRNG